MGSKMKCDQCGSEYNHHEQMEMDRVPVDPDDPERRQGYHKVCDCGAEFWVDRWTREDTITVDGAEFTVSTVFLHIDHGHDGEKLWYETLVNGPRGGGGVMERYETQSEAEAGHEAILAALRAGRYEHVPETWRLKVQYEKGGGESA